jgi:hypothetical protein
MDVVVGQDGALWALGAGFEDFQPADDAVEA